jgi:hypothetical protein
MTMLGLVARSFDLAAVLSQRFHHLGWIEVRGNQIAVIVGLPTAILGPEPLQPRAAHVALILPSLCRYRSATNSVRFGDCTCCNYGPVLLLEGRNGRMALVGQ